MNYRPTRQRRNQCEEQVKNTEHGNLAAYISVSGDVTWKMLQSLFGVWTFI